MSETQLTSSIHEEIPEPYSPQEVARLMVQSFRFSRGQLATQGNILKFLAAHFGARFTPESIEASKPMTLEISSKTVNNQRAHPQPREDALMDDNSPGRISSEVNKIYRHLIEGLDEGKELNQESITLDMREGLVYADASRLPDRPHRRESVNDPYTSNLVEYGLKNHPTGLAEYDEMFRQAVQSFLDPGSELSFIETQELGQVLDQHAKAHPEDQATIEQFKQAVDSSHQAAEAANAA